MQQDFLNTWNEMGKNAYAAAKSLGDLNSKVAEQMIERQLASVNLVVESGLEQLKLAQEVKDVGDYFTRQASLFEQYSGKTMDLAKENAETAQRVGEQYKSWFDEGLAKARVAAEEVSKDVTEKATVVAKEVVKKTEEVVKKAPRVTKKATGASAKS